MDNNNNKQTQQTNALPASKPKLFAWCDFVIPTGFANVAKNLLWNMHAYFDVSVLGINYHGYSKYDTARWFVYPTDNGDPFGYKRMPNILKDSKPEVIFLFQDIFNLPKALEICKQECPDVPIVSYFPIDGEPVSKTWKPVFEQSDYLITYSNFAVKAIHRVFPELTNKKIDILYHGIDSNVFNLMPEEHRLKITKSLKWDNKFTIINVNRFQPRKMVPLTLRAFALFHKGYKLCKCGNIYLASLKECDLNKCDVRDVIKQVAGKEDVLIYLHMNNVERIMGPGSSNYLQSHCLNAGFDDVDLNNSLVINSVDLYAQPLTEQQLNELYNAACVNISTAVGEGFGLSLGESASTGSTNIAPKNSAIPEVLNKHHHVIKNKAHFNMHLDNGHLRPLVDVQGVVEALEIEYQKWLDNDKKKVINVEGIRHVRETFSWDDKREYLTGVFNYAIEKSRKGRQSST